MKTWIELPKEEIPELILDYEEDDETKTEVIEHLKLVYPDNAGWPLHMDPALPQGQVTIKF